MQERCYFCMRCTDEQKNATQIMVKKEDKLYRKTMAEEHYVIVGEPVEFCL